MVVAAVVVASTISTLPASAAGHTVDIAITFDGGDQDCTNGSDKLISSAVPFDVEVCFSQDGSPLAGRDVHLDIVHGDGATERIDGVTDANGVATFTVTPTSAGSTVATICDNEGCYDSVELSSSSPPPPPPVPYSPSGNDLGASEPLTDPPLDMIDSQTGGSAGPETSSALGGMDLRSVRYAGLEDGRATFKVSMVGNGRALFEEGIATWNLSINVTTPEGADYSLQIDNSSGSLTTNAFAAGEKLDDKPQVEWEDENTLCVSVAGVDLAAGSSVTVFTRASREEGSDASFDELSGTPVASDGDDDSGGETESGGGDTTTDDGGGTSTTDGGDGDGFGLLDLGLIGVLAALVLAFFGLYRLYIRPKILYRFDRGDAGVYLDDDGADGDGADDDGADTEDDDEDDDDDDDDETESGPGTMPPGGPPVVSDPPDESDKDCEPERREFAAAEAAKDAAFAAGEQADAELRAAKEKWGELEAKTRNPLGEKPVHEVDPDASAAEQDRQRAVHEHYVGQWQEYEDQANDAKTKVDAAKAEMDEARANSDEKWQDFQRSRQRLEAARVALDNCDGSAPAADDDEPGGGETGGGDAGGDSPGTYTPPPATEPESEEPDGCTEGHEKYGDIIETHHFRILAGDVTLDVPTSASKRAGNVMSPEQFEDLDSSAVEEAAAGLDERVNKATIKVVIPTKIRTIECRQILVCSDNEWVEGRIETIMTEEAGDPIVVLPVGAAGGRVQSRDVRHVGPMVDEAQKEIEALREIEEEANDFSCD